MINYICILYIQLLFILLETTSNLLQPEYSIKILNKENTVFSLGDTGNDDDLEIIKMPSEESQIQEKLKNFHKFIHFAEATEHPKEQFYFPPFDLRNSMPLLEMAYPDFSHSIAVNEKHLSELERRSKFKVKSRRKRKKRKKVDRQSTKIMPEVKKNFLEEDMEYKDLEKEYFYDVAKSMNNNIAFKYSDEGKPEESVKDVIYKIVDVKTPKNCKNFTGIGIQAVECIFKNFKEDKLNVRQFFYSISLILLVWFCIYVLIAIPLWCLKGWCCCCFRCAFCLPRNTVTDIQKYIVLNPPGIHIDSKGVKNQYVPTPKEIEIYEKLRRLIADF